MTRSRLVPRSRSGRASFAPRRRPGTTERRERRNDAEAGKSFNVVPDPIATVTATRASAGSAVTPSSTERAAPPGVRKARRTSRKASAGSSPVGGSDDPDPPPGQAGRPGPFGTLARPGRRASSGRSPVPPGCGEAIPPRGARGHPEPGPGDARRDSASERGGLLPDLAAVEGIRGAHEEVARLRIGDERARPGSSPCPGPRRPRAATTPGKPRSSRRGRPRGSQRPGRTSRRPPGPARSSGPACPRWPRRACRRAR